MQDGEAASGDGGGVAFDQIQGQPVVRLPYPSYSRVGQDIEASINRRNGT